MLVLSTPIHRRRRLSNNVDFVDRLLRSRASHFPRRGSFLARARLFFTRWTVLCHTPTVTRVSVSPLLICHCRKSVNSFDCSSFVNFNQRSLPCCARHHTVIKGTTQTDAPTPLDDKQALLNSKHYTTFQTVQY